MTKDGPVVFQRWQATRLLEIPYHGIEDVEIGGPGLVRTGGGFGGGGFGLAGAATGMAIAAVLNAMTTQVSIKTIVRVQAASCELFLLYTLATPEQLRIGLSGPLGAIRAARTTATPGNGVHDQTGNPASVVNELARLASMLESGLLTREEFNLLKARLLAAS